MIIVPFFGVFVYLIAHGQRDGSSANVGQPLRRTSRRYRSYVRDRWLDRQSDRR